MISVIICTYNRCRLLENTLNSLLELQESDSINWELIVVDNNSGDTTAQVVESFINKKMLPLRYVFEPQQGLSHARNRGVNESAGDIIAFIDDDVIIPGDWLVQADRAFSLYDVDVVSGKVILRLTQPVPSWLDYELQQCFGAFDAGNEVRIFANINDGMAGLGANLCFRRSVFNDIGLFDVTSGRTGKKLMMGEETDLIRRVISKGGKCAYFPEMYLYHVAGSEKISKSYVLRWYFRWGQWEAQCNKYNNNKMLHDLKLMCWLIKEIICDSAIYLKYLLITEDDNSFKTRVNIVRMAGCLSRMV